MKFSRQSQCDSYRLPVSRQKAHISKLVIEWNNYKMMPTIPTIIMLTGRSGLAVACLTAVREVLGSNQAVSSCVYLKNHCDLQSWARAVCTLPAVPRSTQPSTLRRTVNEYQLFGLSNNNKWRWWL